MNNNMLLLDGSHRHVMADVDQSSAEREPLLREALGATLRDYRTRNGFSLRQLATLANISPGYLSEIERGRKEVSSELLAAVCHAMCVSVASVILEAASMMAFDTAAARLTAGMVDGGAPHEAVAPAHSVPASAR